MENREKEVWQEGAIYEQTLWSRLYCSPHPLPSSRLSYSSLTLKGTTCIFTCSGFVSSKSLYSSRLNSKFKNVLFCIITGGRILVVYKSKYLNIKIILLFMKIFFYCISTFYIYVTDPYKYLHFPCYLYSISFLSCFTSFNKWILQGLSCVWRPHYHIYLISEHLI